MLGQRQISGLPFAWRSHHVVPAEDLLFTTGGPRRNLWRTSELRNILGHSFAPTMARCHWALRPSGFCCSGIHGLDAN